MARDKKPSFETTTLTRVSGRAKGYLPDPVDERDKSMRPLLGAPRGLPAECTRLLNLIRRVKDQGSTSSCVGQTLASAIDIRLRAMGINRPEPSSSGAYKIARAMSRSRDIPVSEQPLVDEGCFPRSAQSGLKGYGIPTEEDEPFDPKTINEDLDFGKLEKASVGRIGLYGKIDSTGKARVLDMCNALRQDYPVPFAIQTDGQFEDYAGKGKVIGALSGEKFGGHMVLGLGYYTTPSGEIVFYGLNSWGTSWGESGLFRMSEARIMDSTSRDFSMMQISL